MAGYIRLQEPITITSDQVQDRMDAADISAYDTVLVKITVMATDNNGVITLEQAMTNDEGVFDSSNVSFNLTPEYSRSALLRRRIACCGQPSRSSGAAA